MPVEFNRQQECGILDVQDAPVPCARGATGSVQEQRPHQQSVTCSDGAKNVGLLAAKLLNALG